MTLTLDTNCLIDLEENRPGADTVRALAQSTSAAVRLGVVAISASENQPGGGGAPTFAAFQEKLARIGLTSAEILKPMGVWGLTYWDWCVYADDEMGDLAIGIHRVLFPTSEYDYAEYCAAGGVAVDEERIDPRWRNRRCDVLALWSHTYYRRSVFVTRDSNFLGPAKRETLESMGAGKICSPEDALSAIRVCQA